MTPASIFGLSAEAKGARLAERNLVDCGPSYAHQGPVPFPTFEIERESELTVFMTVLILLIVLLPVLFPAAVSAFRALTSA
jgi:hypothetical protein